MTILNMDEYEQKRILRKELKEWQERLKLCYEFEWRDPCKSICHSEVKRLKELVGEETILEKMARLI